MKLNIHNTSFLGRGWNFPPTFNYHHAVAMMVKEEEDIHQCLHILLSTSPGERLMHPDFGCNLRRLLFEQLSNSLVNIIEGNIQTAIMKFEPRISLEKVTIQDTSRDGTGIIFIKLEYIIRSTNSRSNLVFPFYKAEGTNIIEQHR
jgi:uncharacterized protein